MSAISHQAYGPLVGVPRLLTILAQPRHQVDVLRARLHRVATPTSMRAIVDAGHEVAHHGYLHEAMRGFTEATGGAPSSIGACEALER